MAHKLHRDLIVTLHPVRQMESIKEFDLPAWISALSDVVMALGVIFVWAQIKLLKKQFHDDHERSRRETLINVMREWNRDLKPETAAAQKLVAKLSVDECRRIEHLLELSLNADLYPLIAAVFSGKIAPPNQGGPRLIPLSVEQVAHLRFHVSEYLNALETSLSAWKLGIVDLKHMEEQFSFLLDKQITDASLSVYRSILGENDGLPSIKAFMNRKKPDDVRDPTGHAA